MFLGYQSHSSLNLFPFLVSCHQWSWQFDLICDHLAGKKQHSSIYSTSQHDTIIMTVVVPINHDNSQVETLVARKLSRNCVHRTPDHRYVIGIATEKMQDS